MLAHALEMNNTRVLADVRAFQAWLALKQGRPADAHRWAESLDPNGRLTPLTTFYAVSYTHLDVYKRQTLLDSGRGRFFALTSRKPCRTTPSRRWLPETC